MSNLPTNSNFSSLGSPESNGLSTLGSHSTAVDVARAAKEVEAKMIMARKCPRDEGASYNKLMNTCSRSKFAASGLYEYKKGGATIEGASIKLLEAAARAWGNIESGWREINRYEKSSLIETYAWDLETNYRPKLEFVVDHTIDTKSGPRPLKSERDIYEKIANYASRRVRKCLEQVIPEDVIEDAKARCKQALINDYGDVKKKIRSMVEAFKEYGVTSDLLERRIGNKMDAASVTQLVSLGKIYTSIKDGASEASDWFDMEVEVKIAKDTTKPKAKTTKSKPAPAPINENENENDLNQWKEKLSDLVMTAQDSLEVTAFNNVMNKVKTDSVKNIKKGIDMLNTVIADSKG